MYETLQFSFSLCMINSLDFPPPDKELNEMACLKENIISHHAEDVSFYFYFYYVNGTYMRQETALSICL